MNQETVDTAIKFAKGYLDLLEQFYAVNVAVNRSRHIHDENQNWILRSYREQVKLGLGQLIWRDMQGHIQTESSSQQFADEHPERICRTVECEYIAEALFDVCLISEQMVRYIHDRPSFAPQYVGYLTEMMDYLSAGMQMGRVREFLSPVSSRESP